MTVFELHEESVKNYIQKNHSEWDIDNHLSNGDSIEICENGDVHYNSFTIIKTNIRL